MLFFLHKKEIIILISIIIIGAVIRLIALFNYGTPNFDDMFSLHFASMDLAEMFSFLKDELHPPFYFLLLNFWLKLFENNQIAGQIFSLLFNLAAIPLLYWLVKEIVNKPVGLLSAGIFSLAYFQIFNAIQVRMYSLLTFLGLAALILFWLTLVKQKRNLWPWYVIVNALLILTHLGGVFGIITQWLWFIVLYSKKKISKTLIKKFIWSQIIIMFIWFLWLIPFFLPKLAQIINTGWFLQANIVRGASVGLFDFFFLLLQNYWPRLISGVIIFASPFLILIWSDKKIIQSLQNKINPNWFLLTWLVPAYVIAVLTNINLSRLYLISYLAAYVVVAFLFYIIYKKSKNLFWPLIAVWLLIMVFNLNQNLTSNFSRVDLVEQWINTNQRTGDKIIIHGFSYELVFRNYYKGIVPFEGFYPIDDNKTLEQRVITANWQQIVNNKNIEKFSEAIQGASRILIIREYNIEDNWSNTLVSQWLAKNNWSLTQTYEPQAWFGPKIIVYNK